LFLDQIAFLLGLTTATYAVIEFLGFLHPQPGRRIDQVITLNRPVAPVNAESGEISCRTRIHSAEFSGLFRCP
jgi:hypothetical protein